ncbi:unnamed protein product [Didymodactylos carnosus]|uniref:Uncharacterized protein n=1 Tax=Didymodactylos carnosus TaxID=1234261 RepID=A0A813V3I0_9BILA|nr:unnamed protein product [Didymodactylos carnosus]CAF0839283.1 unnamed protein product [Didymodactylos carnosus]CAF3527049.1 unnamed protein product [Didymodactylos carnosus]CAF3626573.1 unnamed protein product [Didymodactylos carnosus]
MRLSKPALYQSTPVYCESADLCSTAFNTGQSLDVSLSNGISHSALSNILVLPYSFGNVFLGETFSSIVALHNQSDQTLHDCTDIQTATQRISLNTVENLESKQDLAPDQSVCRILQHEVKELGNHSLVCTVTCIDGNGEKCNLKKVFKLQVGKPIELKTRFVPGIEHDEVFVVAEIQNQTPTTLFMVSVDLDPTLAYTATNLNDLNNKKRSENSLAESWRFLRSTEVRQYMFHLKPRANVSFEQQHSVTTLGKLDIIWISGLGEKGRLQTNQLPKPQALVATTNLSNLPDLRLQLVEGNGHCSVEQSQHLRVNILNCTERSMNLSLSFDHQFSKKEGFLWTGVISGNVGKLDAHQLIEIHLNLVPLTSGLKRIGGLKLTDSYMRHTYDLEEFHTLFVLPKFADKTFSATRSMSDTSHDISLMDLNENDNPGSLIDLLQYYEKENANKQQQYKDEIALLKEQQRLTNDELIYLKNENRLFQEKQDKERTVLQNDIIAHKEYAQNLEHQLKQLQQKVTDAKKQYEKVLLLNQQKCVTIARTCDDLYQKINTLTNEYNQMKIKLIEKEKQHESLLNYSKSLREEVKMLSLYETQTTKQFQLLKKLANDGQICGDFIDADDFHIKKRDIQEQTDQIQRIITEQHHVILAKLRELLESNRENGSKSKKLKV